MTKSGHQMTITSGNQAIVHWKDFSINAGEAVHFAQSSSKSKILNRVTTKKLSEIHGNLTSNGQVYLVNPAGVVIGPNGQVQCAAFIASTKNISNDAFLSGKKIDTRGKISGAIRHEGIIQANTIVEDGGRIMLLAKDVSVNGVMKGHTIHVLGDELRLMPNAFIEAPNVLIGGDKQGRNPDIRNAKNVIGDIGAVVRADNLDADGGRVIIWSDGDTRYHGDISARGKRQGGFVEISGGESIAAATHPDVRGETYGTILFDAGPITIDSSGSSGPNTFGDAFINGMLAVGSFTLDTGIVPGPGAETITMVAPADISWSTPTKLSLFAGVSVSLAAGSSIANTNVGPNFDALEIEVRPTGITGVVLAGDISTMSGNILMSSYASGTEEAFFLPGGSMPMPMTMSTVSGNILLNGVVGQITINPFTTISTTSGNIDLTGRATGFFPDIDGLLFTGSFTIETDSGDIFLTGFGGVGPGTHTGLQIRGDVAEITSSSGSINFMGVATSISTVEGVHFGGGGVGPITVSTTSGDITMSGSSVANEGIAINMPTVITSSTGAIRMIGNGNSTAIALVGSSGGVVLGPGASIESTATGPIEIVGVSDTNTVAQGLGQAGVFILSDAEVVSNSGPISITGSSVTGSVATPGVRITSLPATPGSVRTTSGTIDIIGTAGTTADGSQGIQISGGGTVFGNEGILNMTGTGSSAAANFNEGIVITDAGSEISLTSGIATLMGTGQGTGTDNHGIALGSGGLLSANGGAMTATGLGSSVGTTDNSGVLVTGVGTTISTTTGTIDLEGIGRGPGADCDGFQLIGGATVLGNAGSATIRGTYEGNGSPSSHGVVITALGSLLSSTSGNANATGTQLASADPGYGVALIGATPLVTSTSGDITITGMAPNNNLGILVNGGIITNGTGSTLLQTLSDIDINNGATIISGGPITFNSIRDINVIGSNLFLPLLPTVITSTGPVLLIADRNINIFRGIFTPANIESTGSNLTFVVDDEFPAFPNRGPGQFNLGPDNLITAAGELRVYTVQPSQNTIIAPLNGQLFVPGTFAVNSATETWVTYFADGAFGGPNFNIYYKVGVVPDAIRARQVAVSELLTDFVPVIQLQPFFSNSGNFVSNYHGKFGVAWEPYRDPRFEPYSSFIFEDTLYYTDR